MHARRKLQQLYDMAPKEAKRKPPFTGRLLFYIQKLFAIERTLDPERMSYEKIREKRQEKSKEIVNAYFSEIRNSLHLIPKGTILRRAVQYSLDYEDDLKRFLDDGIISITTNAIERINKNFSVTRKNFLFCVSEKGAHALTYSPFRRQPE